MTSGDRAQLLDLQSRTGRSCPLSYSNPVYASHLFDRQRDRRVDWRFWATSNGKRYRVARDAWRVWVSSETAARFKAMLYKLLRPMCKLAMCKLAGFLWICLTWTNFYPTLKDVSIELCLISFGRNCKFSKFFLSWIRTLHFRHYHSLTFKAHFYWNLGRSFLMLVFLSSASKMRVYSHRGLLELDGFSFFSCNHSFFKPFFDSIESSSRSHPRVAFAFEFYFIWNQQFSPTLVSFFRYAFSCVFLVVWFQAQMLFFSCIIGLAENSQQTSSSSSNNVLAREVSSRKLGSQYSCDTTRLFWKNSKVFITAFDFSGLLFALVKNFA